MPLAPLTATDARRLWGQWGPWEEDRGSCPLQILTVWFSRFSQFWFSHFSFSRFFVVFSFTEDHATDLFQSLDFDSGSWHFSYLLDQKAFIAQESFASIVPSLISCEPLIGKALLQLKKFLHHISADWYMRKTNTSHFSQRDLNRSSKVCK